EVRETFQAPKVGTIAGCSVTEGKILRNSSVRVVRDGVVVYTGKIESLRRFKDDVKEVLSGYECGISVEKFNDIKVGDNLEAFVMKEVAATLGASKQEKDEESEK
ncbi:MAG: EF-Tu/IF-2/RF-3 family GTPase, partial [Thermodesulfobacteriota bacterium]